MIKLKDGYIAKNFSAWEFLPKKLHDLMGDKGLRYLDDRIIKIVQEIKNDLVKQEKKNKPVYVNMYKIGTNIQYRGLRPRDLTQGALYSLHKEGIAVDISTDEPAIILYEIIQDNHDKYYDLGVRRLENPEYTKGRGLGWLHIDLKEEGSGFIRTFNP